MYFCCIKQIEKTEKKYSSQPFLPPIYYYFWQDNNFSSKTIMKRNLTFLAFTLLFLPAALLAQQKTVYSRMNGKIGDRIDVAGNFQRSGSRMEGNYSFKLEVNDSLTHLSHIVTLYGDIDRHNEVIFKQYHTDDTAIDGLFYDQRFVGSWYDHKGSTVQPFTLTESYPKGSMPMNIFYLHSDKELVPRAQGSPSAEIELTLLYPKSSTHISQAVVDSVKKFIQEQFFGQYKPGQLPAGMLSKSEHNFYNWFGELNSHWKTNHKLGFNLEKRVQVSVIFNGYDLLCLQYKKRGYSGRGNPMEHISYDMVDLRNGEKLTFENIFKPEMKTALTRLINKKTRMDNGLSDSDSLKKAGFYYNNIPISEDISFSGNGIYLIYNIYDIAPPAMGIQKVFLPFSELGSYIKPSSVLYPLSR